MSTIGDAWTFQHSDPADVGFDTSLRIDSPLPFTNLENLLSLKRDTQSFFLAVPRKSVPRFRPGLLPSESETSTDSRNWFVPQIYACTPNNEIRGRYSKATNHR
jgi:hypothetical protein